MSKRRALRALKRDRTKAYWDYALDRLFADLDAAPGAPIVTHYWRRTEKRRVMATRP